MYSGFQWLKVKINPSTATLVQLCEFFVFICSEINIRLER